MSGYRRSDVPGLSSSSEDSDDDDVPLKRMKVRPSAMDLVDVDGPQVGGRLEAREGITTSVEKARKKNNIWSSVIAEETLSSELVDVGVRNKSLFKERDVESYDYTAAFELQQASDDHDVLNLHPGDEEMDREEDIFADAPDEDELTRVPAKKRLGSRAKEGKEEAICDRASVRDRLGLTQVEGDTKKASDEKASVRDRLGSSDQKSDVKERLGKDDGESLSRRHHSRSSRKKKKTFDGVEVDEAKLAQRRQRFGDIDPPEKLQQSMYIELTPEDSIPRIVNGLSSNLQEPKIELLHDIVKLVGAKKAIDLMHETEMIEESGGLLINDGSRRRTPGGVFLFLLRNDRSVPKDELNAIMAQDRMSGTGKKKNRKRKREGGKPDDFAKLLTEHKQCAERPHPPSPNSDSNPTVDPYPHKINTDDALRLDDDVEENCCSGPLDGIHMGLDEESSHAMCAEDVTLPAATATTHIDQVQADNTDSNKAMELEDGELEDGEVSD